MWKKETGGKVEKAQKWQKDFQKDKQISTKTNTQKEMHLL